MSPKSRSDINMAYDSTKTGRIHLSIDDIALKDFFEDLDHQDPNDLFYEFCLYSMQTCNLLNLDGSAFTNTDHVYMADKRDDFSMFAFTVVAGYSYSLKISCTNHY